MWLRALRGLKGPGNPYIRMIGTVQDMTERKRPEEKLLEYQRQLPSLSRELCLTEERRRRQIATELHDRVGQHLALCKLKLAALRKAGLPRTDGTLFQEIDRLIQQTIQDTRSLIFELSPPILYEQGLRQLSSGLLNRHNNNTVSCANLRMNSSPSRWRTI